MHSLCQIEIDYQALKFIKEFTKQQILSDLKDEPKQITSNILVLQKQFPNEAKALSMITNYLRFSSLLKPNIDVSLFPKCSTNMYFLQEVLKRLYLCEKNESNIDDCFHNYLESSFKNFIKDLGNIENNCKFKDFA